MQSVQVYFHFLVSSCIGPRLWRRERASSSISQLCANLWGRFSNSNLSDTLLPNYAYQYYFPYYNCYHWYNIYYCYCYRLFWHKKITKQDIIELPLISQTLSPLRIILNRSVIWESTSVQIQWWNFFLNSLWSVRSRLVRIFNVPWLHATTSDRVYF